MNNAVKIIVLVMIFLSTTHCFSQEPKKDFIYTWDTSEDSIYFKLDRSLQKYTPTQEEIQKAKELSNNFIKSLERKRKSKKNGKLGSILEYNLDEYFRQYIGFVDKHGKKIILIYAFCSSFGEAHDLKHNVVLVFDGGSCFYNIKINLETNKCYDFSVNGDT